MNGVHDHFGFDPRCPACKKFVEDEEQRHKAVAAGPALGAHNHSDDALHAGCPGCTGDFSYLPDNAKDHPAYPAFVQEMTGCIYGSDAINQAWSFYKAGWEAFEAALTNGMLAIMNDINKHTGF